MTDQSLIEYQGGNTRRIRKCFFETVQQFPALKRRRLILRKHPGLRQSTMRAQPVFNRNFWNRKRRAYKVEITGHIQLNRIIALEQLPEAVLKGWFAHELGHVMDYLDRGVWGLTRFVLGYLFSKRKRRRAEREADLFAIQHGFSPHLITTKRYILNHADLPNWYTKNIHRYYLSPDEIEAMVLENQERDLP